MTEKGTGSLAFPMEAMVFPAVPIAEATVEVAAAVCMVTT